MASDFSELDQLIESDVLEALGQEVPQELLESEAKESANDTEIEETQTSDLDALLSENAEDIPSEIGSSEDTIDSIGQDEPLNIDNEEDISHEPEEIEDIGDIEILPLAEIESALEEQEDEDDINLSSINGDTLAKLLSQLLNNKTIEITIKVKD